MNQLPNLAYLFFIKWSCLYRQSKSVCVRRSMRIGALGGCVTREWHGRMTANTHRQHGGVHLLVFRIVPPTLVKYILFIWIVCAIAVLE